MVCVKLLIRAGLAWDLWSKASRIVSKALCAQQWDVNIYAGMMMIYEYTGWFLGCAAKLRRNILSSKPSVQRYLKLYNNDLMMSKRLNSNNSNQHQNQKEFRH